MSQGGKPNLTLKGGDNAPSGSGGEHLARLEQMADPQAFNISMEDKAHIAWAVRTIREKAARLSEAREAAAYAYQLAGGVGAGIAALDNLCAVAQGEKPPHEWPVAASEELEEITRLQNERDACITEVGRMREAAYLECAGFLCSRCAEGDKPEWRVALQGFCHIWKAGNGHSACGAALIWEKIARRALDREVKP